MTADGDDEQMDLVLKAPTVTMDGVTVFDAHNWSSVRPHLRIQHFRTPVGDKKINFYRFEYWQPLAYLKCLYVVAPDTRVEGTSSRATYCNQHYKTTGGSRRSSSPDGLPAMTAVRHRPGRNLLRERPCGSGGFRACGRVGIDDSNHRSRGLWIERLMGDEQRGAGGQYPAHPRREVGGDFDPGNGRGIHLGTLF